MCTVTWCRPAAGYEVFFNRDELLSRPPAEPPAVRESNGVRYLAPLDPQGGGTWLAVNERGLTLGLLNHYESGQPAGSAPAASRGRLVTSLADCATQEEVTGRLHLRHLLEFAPFFLLVFAPDRPVHWHRWDGFRRMASVLRDEDMPVTTSSFDAENVIAARRACLHRIVPDGTAATAAQLAAFHRSTDPRGGAYSVRMTRPDAQTVSISQVSVAPGAVTLRYAPRAPGAEAFAGGIALRLDRT